MPTGSTSPQAKAWIDTLAQGFGRDAPEGARLYPLPLFMAVALVWMLALPIALFTLAPALSLPPPSPSEKAAEVAALLDRDALAQRAAAFWSVAVLTGPFLVVSGAAQLRLVRRHWRALWAPVAPDEAWDNRRAPTICAFFAAVLAGVMSVIALHMLVTRLAGTVFTAPWAGFGFYALAGLGFALLGGLLAVTTFGALSFARGAQSDTAAAALTKELFGPDARLAHQSASTYWSQMIDWVEAHPTAPLPRANVASDIYPSDCVAMVRAMMVPMAIALVLVVTTMSLGMDYAVAEADAAEPSDAAKARAATIDAAVIVIGMGFSLCLAVAYVLPMLRLGPALAAETALAAAKPGAKAKPKATGAAAVVVMRRDGSMALTADATPEAPPEVSPERKAAERMLANHIGADKKTFEILLTTPRYGAAFQVLVGDTLLDKYLPILNMIAPAVAGTLLALLK